MALASAIDDRGGGEMAFGAMTAALNCGYTPSGVDFTWDGADEGDQVCGEGWAELQDDGSLVGEISNRNGDETSFKATAIDRRLNVGFLAGGQAGRSTLS